MNEQFHKLAEQGAEITAQKRLKKLAEKIAKKQKYDVARDKLIRKIAFLLGLDRDEFKPFL